MRRSKLSQRSSLWFTASLAIACGGTPDIAEPGQSAAAEGGSGGEVAATTNGGAQVLTQRGGSTSAAGCTGTSCIEVDPSEGVSFCGDSTLDANESCDDGNATPGDGCDGVCRLESGYSCATAGQPCTSTLFCGDGIPGPNEACDDGNADGGDGCASNCTVEPGFACNAFGEPCVPATGDAVCGNSDVESGEFCDDGSLTAGDGCDASCQLETGWTCPTPGEPCERNEFCGDGLLNGQEQCDDGNARAGDCCTGTCQLESNCVCSTPEPALDPPRQLCTSTVVCGDNRVTGGEFCDDGNTTGGDGCKADCTDAEAGYVCPATGGVCTIPAEACGNRQLDAGETCDDGDQEAGDGCAADCSLESGWVCSAPTDTAASSCTLLQYCGDGVVTYSRGETCDDGDDPTAVDADGDGCSALCRVEAGFKCTGAPSVCGPSVVCGDRKLGGSETCDDGGTADDDGCSASCTLENGYTCPFVGIACQPVCGDGLVRGSEQCDDDNNTAGDGCSATCAVETPADTERDAWVCTTADSNSPSVCSRTTCGNGSQEGSEQCDDGNNDMGDGCTPFCRLEPTCPSTGGACSTPCGDGILLGTDTDQSCDDGNTVSGDGCSSTCQEEDGYVCTSEPVERTTLTLPIVLRDFTPSSGANDHPDFEYNTGFEQGIVQNALDSDGKPIHVTVNKSTTSNAYTDNVLTSTDWFSYWYRDNATYNKTFIQTLPFTKQTTGEFKYTNNRFYPLNGLGWGNYTSSRNYHFTSEVRYWFEYQGGEQLEFMGDDDVWVFVNKQLAVDLGGVHTSVYGSVVLDATSGTGTVCENAALNCSSPKTVDFGMTIGSVYEIVVFQAERHTSESNYTLTLGNFNATRSVCTPDCGDAKVTANEQCDLGDGNTGAYGGCNADVCTLAPYCGDGTVDTTLDTDLDGDVDTDDGEVCDDGVNGTPYTAAQSTTECAPNCRLPHYCGDEQLDTDYGEACDKGASNAADAYGINQCLDTCMPAPYCGDGFRNGSEACDKGALNGIPGSLCDVKCQITCGNEDVDPGEQCDEGTLNNTGDYGGCRSNCTLAGYCGDGYQNGAEACDDGRNDGSYGTCDSDCTLADYCGDETVNDEGGELCDDGDDGNVISGYGPGLCTTRCRPAPYCGDGAVDPTHESCDDGASNSSTVAGACKPDCTGYNPPPATCGNGVKNSGEECDDGGLNGTSSSLCDARCQYKCGNGIKDTGEACDDGVNDGTYGSCKADCTLADYCGDGTKNGSEQCDRGSGNEATPYGKNTDGSYKCTLACQLGPYCGDDRVYSTEEECDGQTGCLATCEWAGTILQ